MGVYIHDKDGDAVTLKVRDKPHRQLAQRTVLTTRVTLTFLSRLLCCSVVSDLVSAQLLF